MLSRNREQKSPAKRFLFVLGLAFLLLYFILGVTVIFWDDMPVDLEPGYRTAFGVLLIVYSVIRFFRIIRG